MLQKMDSTGKKQTNKILGLVSELCNKTQTIPLVLEGMVGRGPESFIIPNGPHALTCLLFSRKYLSEQDCWSAFLSMHGAGDLSSLPFLFSSPTGA